MHQNQYGFIKIRTIQDCLAWSFEFLHTCNKSGELIILLKLDFEKAFDKIEYNAILKTLHARGFGPKWCNWIQSILLSATSNVLLNGIPGKIINCRRGVRQGDPLSPLLFVLVADLLQSALNKSLTDGDIQRPITPGTILDFPVIQYADDTLIIMPANPDQLTKLKDILHQFQQSTGLKVNF